MWRGEKRKTITLCIPSRMPPLPLALVHLIYAKMSLTQFSCFPVYWLVLLAFRNIFFKKPSQELLLTSVCPFLLLTVKCHERVFYLMFQIPLLRTGEFYALWVRQKLLRKFLLFYKKDKIRKLSHSKENRHTCAFQHSFPPLKISCSWLY